MSSSVQILHYYFSALPGFSARDSDISTCYFYEVKITCSDITVFSWETRYSWEILMQYPNTRRHFLEHMWKLGGRALPDTPTYRRAWTWAFYSIKTALDFSFLEDLYHLVPAIFQQEMIPALEAMKEEEEKKGSFIYTAKFVMITDDLGHALLPYSGYVICCPYVESVSSFLISRYYMKMHSRSTFFPDVLRVNSPFFSGSLGHVRKGTAQWPVSSILLAFSTS